MISKVVCKRRENLDYSPLRLPPTQLTTPPPPPRQKQTKKPTMSIQDFLSSKNFLMPKPALCSCVKKFTEYFS